VRKVAKVFLVVATAVLFINWFSAFNDAFELYSWIGLAILMIPFIFAALTYLLLDRLKDNLLGNIVAIVVIVVSTALVFVFISPSF
jgi:hypothetical protein